MDRGRRRSFRARIVVTSSLLLTVLLCCASEAAGARDVDIRYSILDSQVRGNKVVGLIEVRVANVSSEPIDNFVLRLAEGRGNSVETNLLRFGAIPPRQVRILVRRFAFSKETVQAGAIPWLADFDHPQRRSHKQIPAMSLQDRRGGKK